LCKCVRNQSNGNIKVGLYSDEFKTLLEEESFTAVEVSQQKFVQFIFGVEGGTATHTIDGAVEWIQIWTNDSILYSTAVADANDASLTVRQDE